MYRHITPTFAMLTGDEVNDERRTTDLLVMDDGREAAILRWRIHDDFTTFYLTTTDDPDTVAVAMFHEVAADDDTHIIDFPLPRAAAEELILAHIEATR